MKPKLIVTLILIVFLPLGILGWLGVRVARNEREIVRHRFHDLLVSRLRDIDADIAELLAEREREVLSRPGFPTDTSQQLQEVARRSGVVRQYFALDPEGDLVFPSAKGPSSRTQQEFLERTERIWQNREIPRSSEEDAGPASSLQSQVPSVAPRAKGWYTWYWGKGINLICWERDAQGNIVGAELDPIRLMADIVGILPDTDPLEPALADGRIALLDSNADIIYQWGGYEPPEDEGPQASLALSPPLSSWGLEYYARAESLGTPFGGSVMFNLLSGLGVLALTVVALAAYYYRESSREIREATQRISFVNKVSHELKTPLTNIRMYAEMLEGELDDADEKPRRHLGIIVEESQRLSRLIGNVLTFSRKQRSALKLHRAVGNVDEVLRAVLDHFQAPLRAKGIEIAFDGRASEDAEFDQDVLEQIVGNLLSNVEKYAAPADRVTITSEQDGDAVHVTVADNGSGIPPKERARIFEPFYRISNKLTDGVAGTGIGLAIARDLARLHGGDLTLEPTSQGACFKLTIHAPRKNPGDAQ